MDSKQSLDIFGKFLVKNLRDKGIRNAETLLSNKSKAPSNLKLQTEISQFNESQKKLIKEIVIKSIDIAIHDFLFSLQELADFENNIQISINSKNIVELSDGIHGESYSENGWNAKFSKYGAKE
ncbi:hypothetical protein NYQ10_10810 [Flavobacterium johnsoniae]|uniref:hypothetical protein n=1 Tax=Flavobacterium johnsoniae TaxID=986 RepID=UPI0025B21AA4|nr:hypothetical protein [Flavobacterium johnsoniae]WJS96923.1 hypothetical protein NYQ10_10810 [Flavobacterium johnsoniae]